MLVDMNLEEEALVNPTYIVNEITDSERGHFRAYHYGKSSVSISVFLKKVGSAEEAGGLRLFRMCH